MRLLTEIMLVAVGSAFGGLARWGVGTVAGRWLGTSMPWGTFVVNITGCFFLGWLLTMLADRFAPHETYWIPPDHVRLALGVGFTGAYTTFSTLGWEAHGLLRDGGGWLGFGYVIASVVLGLVALRLGVELARAF